MLNEKEAQLLSDRISYAITSEGLPYYLCIGTTKVIGDLFGPYVGEILEKTGELVNDNWESRVVGTLSDPVHALNLEEKIDSIPEGHPIIAVDAAMCAEEENCGRFMAGKSIVPATSNTTIRHGFVGDASLLGAVGYQRETPDKTQRALETASFPFVRDMARTASAVIILADRKIQLEEYKRAENQ